MPSHFLTRYAPHFASHSNEMSVIILPMLRERNCCSVSLNFLDTGNLLVSPNSRTLVTQISQIAQRKTFRRGIVGVE